MSDPVDDLAAADRECARIEDEIERIGEERLAELAEAYREFSSLLDRYDGRATGSGREVFQSYVEFEAKLEEFVEGLPDDLMERGAFEEAEGILDRRRLDERDFERARGALSPAAEAVALLDERAEARERYRDARHRVRERVREIDDRIDDLEATRSFADADFDAPTDELREPIEAYDDAVADAFADFKADAPAREVIDLIEATQAYPLVEFRPPPEDLREYVMEREVGGEPIPTLLRYAEFSFSKLGHYVDDPGEFKATVGANRTYLERLDAGPLSIGWPPPAAERLAFRIRELVAVVGRFAPEDVTERLRELRDLARTGEYERLREAAMARHELDEGERERLRSGGVERELEELREERERLERALAEHPER